MKTFIHTLDVYQRAAPEPSSRARPGPKPTVYGLMVFVTAPKHAKCQPTRPIPYARKRQKPSNPKRRPNHQSQEKRTNRPRNPSAQPAPATTARAAPTAAPSPPPSLARPVLRAPDAVASWYEGSSSREGGVRDSGARTAVL